MSTRLLYFYLILFVCHHSAVARETPGCEDPKTALNKFGDNPFEPPVSGVGIGKDLYSKHIINHFGMPAAIESKVIQSEIDGMMMVTTWRYKGIKLITSQCMDCLPIEAQVRLGIVSMEISGSDVKMKYGFKMGMSVEEVYKLFGKIIGYHNPTWRTDNELYYNTYLEGLHVGEDYSVTIASFAHIYIAFDEDKKVQQVTLEYWGH